MFVILGYFIIRVDGLNEKIDKRLQVREHQLNFWLKFCYSLLTNTCTCCRLNLVVG